MGAKSTVTTNRPETVDAYDASAQVKVYDNGKLLGDDMIAADGSLTITYYNPNKHSDKSGNHNIEVVYLYDVTFNCAADNLKIKPEIHNNESLGADATEFEYLNYYNAAAPVLESVREDSSVRFKVELTGADASQVRPMVKVAETVLSADEEGYYTVDVTDSNLSVGVFTVPVNGATLSPAEVAAINPEEAVDVTSIALSGEIAPADVKNLIDKLPALEELDLSALSEALPESAMAGKETLVTVTLPSASAIEAGTFEGCINLTNVVVPECVNVIGANSFKDCASLRNLSFSGITGVGANAFSGCDRLTSIIFTDARPDAQPALVRRRARAAEEGYDADAFAGLNPNCVVYLDEGVAVPANTDVNYVRVRRDAASETGRVYEAIGSITINPDYDFQAVNAFNITEGNSISMDMQLNGTDKGYRGWKSLVLPFSPMKVTDEAGNEMSQYVRDNVSNEYGLYMTATPDADGTLKLMSGIRSNTPYLAALYQDGGAASVRFVADNCEVPQTPAEIRTEGEDYALMATLSGRDLAAATTYVLREDGSAFEVVGAAAEALAEGDGEETVNNVTVKPFSVYAVSDAGVSSFPIDVNVAKTISTGIDTPDAAPAFMISRENGVLVIYSDCDTAIDVFNVAGQLVKTLQVVKGRNAAGTLVAGVYIIRGQKVVL